MINVPKEMEFSEPMMPLDRSVKTQSKRNEEIRQQAVKDAKKSFRPLREQLREIIRTDSSSTNSKSE